MLQLHIDVTAVFVLLLLKSTVMGIKMTKNGLRSAFLQQQHNDYRISKKEDALKEGRLVVLPGSGAYVSPEEAEDLKNDLAKDGYKIIQNGEDTINAAKLYLPDGINFVFVRKKDEPVQAPAFA